MTPVDTLDTLLLMGLKDEADKAKALIVEKLSFDSLQGIEPEVPDYRSMKLFAPEETLDLDKVVFNTEAHPLRRTWQE